jgi:hypothetical protein
MSKRRIPTKVLEMSGALKKNPQRAAERANEPQPTEPIGDPPADFLREHSLEASRHLAAWKDIVAQVPDGVLTSADRAHVEMTARVMARTRIPGAKSSDFALLDKLLGKLGCNPADRSRVASTKKKPGDADEEWEEFASSRRQAGAR